VKNPTTVFTLLLIISFSLSAVAVPSVDASEDSWTTMAELPTARSGLEVAVVDGKIYAIGGINQEGFRATTEEYDPTTNSWTFKASMPTARSAFGIAVYQNKIYCIGGYTDGFSATEVNEVYDPATNTWETRTPMPTPRMGIQANIVDDKIYVIGGIPNGTINEVYDPATDTWFIKASIPTAVSSYASAVVDNKIYVITSNLNQIYHPENDSWSNGAPPPLPAVLASAAATTEVFAPKRIFVFGADADLPFWQLTFRNFTTQSYDPKTNNWMACASMPTGRFDPGVAVVNDMLYVIGGFTIAFPTDKFTLNPSITYSAVNEQYTPIGYIPEFPSWTPLLIMVVVVTVIVVIYKRKLQKTYRSTNVLLHI